MALSPERIAKAAKKSKARRVALRQLNRHIEFLQQSLSNQFNECSRLRKENANLTKHLHIWNGRCSSCSLREWYRFRQGETYPGRPGWRFLSWLPLWRWS